MTFKQNSQMYTTNEKLCASEFQNISRTGAFFQIFLYGQQRAKTQIFLYVAITLNDIWT